MGNPQNKKPHLRLINPSVRVPQAHYCNSDKTEHLVSMNRTSSKYRPYAKQETNSTSAYTLSNVKTKDTIMEYFCSDDIFK